MAVALTIKKGSNYPYFEAQLTDNGVPVNLEGAAKVKVYFKGKGAGGEFSGTCDVLNAKEGLIRFKWTTANVGNVDEYDGEAEIEWAPGQITVLPNSGTFVIKIETRLN